jgi:methylated-DNA-[protein]-cysteine S-methyltransferase
MPTESRRSGGYVFPSELGWMAIAWRDAKVVQLTFGQPSAAAALAQLEDGTENVVSDRALPDWVAGVVSNLQDYAAGQNVSFGQIPVAIEHLTAFQQRVVQECRKIRRGQTRSYGELAAAAGSPGASRAVGNVMARNKLPIIIPCHRVVGAGTSLGGFSAPEGLSMKQRMLRLEGAERAQPTPASRADQKSIRRRAALAG